MPWLSRGLNKGVVTTKWPRNEDRYQSESLSNLAQVRPGATGLHQPEAAAVCPTGAVADRVEGMAIEQSRCIGCGACVAAFPDLFEFATGSAQARLVDGNHEASEVEVAALRTAIATRTRALGRSVHLRHVDAGSDGSEEWEINALFNPYYDINRLGLFLTPSPRHADLLVVTGIGATGMLAPLARTWEGMPHPKLVIAVGTDACSGGLWAHSYAGSQGVTDAVPVDVWVPGSPPTPFAILYAILLALGRLPDAAEGSGGGRSTSMPPRPSRSSPQSTSGSTSGSASAALEVSRKEGPT
jgi:Ni,Fe-hydrogenase III small subunit/ferredoxin